MPKHLRVPNAIIALIIFGLLSGCTAKPPLTKKPIARLLLENQAANCDPQTIYIRAGKFGSGQAQHFENWFAKSVLTDPRFVHVVESRDEANWSGELAYLVGGERYRAAWSGSDRSDSLLSNTLSIVACVYVPRRITVVDASFDTNGTTARVIFAEKFELSLLGQMLSKEGVLKKYDPISAPQGYEYVALLNKDHSGQWRVAGTGVN